MKEILSRGGFYLSYQAQPQQKFFNPYIGDLYLGTDVFGKTLLKEGFLKIFPEDGLQKYYMFWNVVDKIKEEKRETVGVFKLLIKRPIIYLVETFRFQIDSNGKFFYFMGDKGNVIRFAGSPNFLIEYYAKYYDKQDFVDLIKAMYATNDLIPKHDWEYGIFKMNYDHERINLYLAKRNAKNNKTRNIERKGDTVPGIVEKGDNKEDDKE